MPAVGDWVSAEISPDGGLAVINEVLERKSRFSRKVSGVRTDEQVLAANLDFLFWVTSANRDFNPRRVERFLFSAAESGAEPVIIINKADLTEDAGQHWKN